MLPLAGIAKNSYDDSAIEGLVGKDSPQSRNVACPKNFSMVPCKQLSPLEQKAAREIARVKRKQEALIERV